MSFRKRKNPIITSQSVDMRYVVRKIGDNEFVTNELPQNVEPLPEPSPTLDDMLRAGVSPKEVNLDGILDSYDENDYPIADTEDRIVEGIAKSKSNKNKVKE